MSIQLEFEQYHDAHPAVYEEFCRLVFAGIGNGKTRISAKFICEMIRWDRPVLKRGETLDNNFTSRYARMFQADFPAHADIFQTREITA